MSVLVRLTVRCLQHVCLTIAVALVFHTDLDSPFGPTFGLEDPTAYQLFREDIEARKVHFDILLVSTFLVCIPGCDSPAWQMISSLPHTRQRLPSQGACHRSRHQAGRYGPSW